MKIENRDSKDNTIFKSKL